MANDDTVLAVRFEARIRDFERNLQKANRSASSGFSSIEKRAAQMSARLNSSLAGAARGLAAPLIGVASIRGAQTLLDTATRVQNALKVAGLEGEGLAKVYDQLYASAQKNAAPLESLVTLYSRVSQVQGELGVTSEQIVGFTDNIALSLRVAGTDAAAASGALMQLSQALGSGVVRAEEFSSINEAIPTVMQAAAAGIVEAGGSVAKLRQLMLDGKLASKAFFDGVNAGSSLMEDRVSGAEMTISQRLVRLQNVLEDAAGRFNKAAGTSDAFGSSIDALTGFIQRLDMGQIVSQIDTVINALANGERAIFNFANAVGKGLGLDKVGELLTNNSLANGLGLYSLTAVDRRMSGDAPEVPKDVQDYIARTYGGAGAGKPMTVDVKPTEPKVKPITLADYTVPSKDKGKGGRKGKKERQDDFAREVQQIKERTAATLAETAAMAGLNPLVNDYGYALEKARAEHELLAAAQKAGKAITPELRSEIALLADQYAQAAVEADKLSEAQDKVRQSADDAAEFNKALLRGMVDGFVEGKKAADIFADALSNIGNRLLDMAFDSAFSTQGSGGFLANLLGGLGGLFPKREHGGPVTAGQPYIVGEKRPEVFVPGQSGHIIPQVPNISPTRNQGGGGSTVQATYAPNIDMRGASVEAVARLEQIMVRDKAEFSSKVVKAVRDARDGRQL